MQERAPAVGCINEQRGRRNADPSWCADEASFAYRRVMTRVSAP